MRFTSIDALRPSPARGGSSTGAGSVDGLGNGVIPPVTMPTISGTALCCANSSRDICQPTDGLGCVTGRGPPSAGTLALGLDDGARVPPPTSRAGPEKLLDLRTLTAPGAYSAPALTEPSRSWRVLCGSVAAAPAASAPTPSRPPAPSGPTDPSADSLLG